MSCAVVMSPGETMADFSGSTTAEQQHHWRTVKQELRSITLLFDIPTTRLVKTTLSKYVVYQIVVIQSGNYDSKPATVERRFSDVLQLHQALLQDFSEEMKDVVVPKKKWTGNFTEQNIAERRVALRDYLTQLYSRRPISRSQAFQAFFTHQELTAAYSLLRAGRFAQALQDLQKVLVLQEKFILDNPTWEVPTLCAILVCHVDLGDSEAAFQAGTRALHGVRRHQLRRYWEPLLEALVYTGYGLGLNVVQLQEELMRVRESSDKFVNQMSIKQLVIQEFEI